MAMLKFKMTQIKSKMERFENFECHKDLSCNVRDGSKEGEKVNKTDIDIKNQCIETLYLIFLLLKG